MKTKFIYVTTYHIVLSYEQKITKANN